MKIIKTLNDLRRVKKNSNLEEGYLDYIEKHLKRIWYTFGDEPIEDHPDRETAYLVILEKEAELKKEEMMKIGVPCDLVEVGFEYLDQVEHKEMTIYIMGILKTNEMLMELIMREAQFSKEIKEWLRENSVPPDYYEEDDIDEVPF